MSAPPIVSIGLPTYNRAAKLRRAMEFVLAQDYPHFEVVISDNASTDETPHVCGELVARDSRVRYIRQETNIGPTANYRAVLKAATGDLYMALADDDWIAPNYISACVERLLSDPGLVLVCGRSKMYQDGEFSHDAVRTMLSSDSPEDRVVEYFRTVSENGAFHGVIRRDVLTSLPEMKRVMAGDWLWMASIAFQGKIETIEAATITKHLGGSTVTWETITQTVGLPAWQARFWSEAILSAVIPELVWRSPVYASLGPRRRLILGARVARVLAEKWRLWIRWKFYLRTFLRNRLAFM